MSVSQSGYPDIASYGDPRLISNPTVPGSNVEIRGGLLKGDVATILLYVAARFNVEVQRLVQSRGCWGFDPSHNTWTSSSNHESGTAEDLMAADHPIGTDPRSNFSRQQIRAIHKILRACRVGLTRVVRWGGDYYGRKDGMHFEINDNLYGSPKVAKLAAKIRGGKVPNVPAELRTGAGEAPNPVPKPKPKPEPKPDPDDRPRQAEITADGVTVESLQLALNVIGASPQLAVDNAMGSHTTAAVRWAQRVCGVKVDLYVGPKTVAAINDHVRRAWPLGGRQVFGTWNHPGWSRLTRSGDPRWDGDNIRHWVRLIQTGLHVKAGAPGGSWIDGVYGEPTDDYVRRFQRRHRLAVDGLTGRDTFTALFKL